MQTGFPSVVLGDELGHWDQNRHALCFEGSSGAGLFGVCSLCEPVWAAARGLSLPPPGPWSGRAAEGVLGLGGDRPELLSEASARSCLTGRLSCWFLGGSVACAPEEVAWSWCVSVCSLVPGPRSQRGGLGQKAGPLLGPGMLAAGCAFSRHGHELTSMEFVKPKPSLVEKLFLISGRHLGATAKCAGGGGGGGCGPYSQLSTAAPAQPRR